MNIFRIAAVALVAALAASTAFGQTTNKAVAFGPKKDSSLIVTTTSCTSTCDSVVVSLFYTKEDNKKFTLKPGQADTMRVKNGITASLNASYENTLYKTTRKTLKVAQVPLDTVMEIAGPNGEWQRGPIDITQGTPVQTRMALYRGTVRVGVLPP